MMFIGEIRDGRLELDRDAIRNLLLEMGDGEVYVQIEKLLPSRSQRQNAYYWAVVIPTSVKAFRNEGWQVTDAEEVHEIYKQKFLRRCIVNLNTGETEEYYGSTARLTTEEFMEYVENIRQFVAEHLNSYIPDPGEYI